MNDSDLGDYVERQREWSRRTFGPGQRTIGLTRHIEKECAEIREAPTDREEWIDVIILAIDGFWRAGGQPDDLSRLLQAKQEKNFARQWPPAGPETEPVEHVR